VPLVLSVDSQEGGLSELLSADNAPATATAVTTVPDPAVDAPAGAGVPGSTDTR
jgi:hypothetical protein